MSKARILEEDWPVVVVEWPERASADGVQQHFDEMMEMIQRTTGPFAVVLDASKAKGMDADLRARTARGIEKLSNAARTRIKAIAYVVPSAVMRGIITAIHWLVRAPAPIATFATRPDGMRWARAQLSGGAGAASPS